ncbi:DUF108 domain-containing protein [bacterium]|nr:DUF108 domain-containing protein [bacterium]
MNSLPALTIVGAGCIGRRIAQAIAQRELAYSLAAVSDIEQSAAEQLRDEYAPEAAVLGLEAATALCDVLVECAAGAAVPAVVDAARLSYEEDRRPGHVLIMSVGGLLGVSELETPGPVIHVPSGALGGLDAVQAMKVAGLDEVILTSSKPPQGLGLEVAERTVVFEGSAAEVIKLYPKNVNVAIALSLAGIGAERTKVQLVADPAIERNTHHLVARGAAGEVEFISRNMPFPENPRTSYLAALSAVAALKRLTAQLQVG